MRIPEKLNFLLLKALQGIIYPTKKDPSQFEGNPTLGKSKEFLPPEFKVFVATGTSPRLGQRSWLFLFHGVRCIALYSRQVTLQFTQLKFIRYSEGHKIQGHLKCEEPCRLRLE